jgi:glycosyltransferase involved in cell wall biosynthesis
MAIEACRLAGVPLRIVGRGPEEARLRHIAGPAVEFLGWRSDEEIRDLYGRSAAVLLPGVEDFGMVPVEAQACGAPVVALRSGGACETVQDEVTGVLVDDGSAQTFAEGIARVRSLDLDPSAIRANAERFSRDRFMTDFQAAVSLAMADREAAR